jgi:TPR repeat protein
MLMEGKGVPIPHYTEAAHFLSLAASETSNVPQALYLLALIYEYGV